MKSILLGDLHIGTKKDDPYLHSAIHTMLQFVCQYAVDNGIKILIQSGDWFDVRSGLSQETLCFQREKVTPLITNTFDETYVLVGNHDMHLKNKITPNSVFEVFSGVEGIHVVEDPVTINVGNTMWDLFPWECDENETQIRSYIENSNSDYSMGHWELDGFEFYKGIPSTGVDREFLSKYTKAFSGHYHTSSSKANVQYIGTPYTLTLGDANDIRGFWVFDSEDGSVEFVANPDMWHHKVIYNDKFDPAVIPGFKDKIVHMIVQKSDADLDLVLTQMESVCYKFTYKQTETLTFSADDDIEIESLVDVMQKYVKSLDITQDEQDDISNYIKELYAEANA